MGSLFNCIRVINYYKFCFLSNNLFTATIRRFLCHSYNNPSSLFLRSENSFNRKQAIPLKTHDIILSEMSSVPGKDSMITALH
uniref:Uncharacterized protein n=1 Tax=Escherichia coli TaxID=562 RepID=A0A890DK02_ECOLX|nr:hypothetical protein [Escherichia coli]